MEDVITESLKDILEKFESIDTCILGTAIVNRNGLLQTARVPRNIDEKRFGALSATLFEAIEKSAEFIKNMPMNNLTIEYNDCQLIIIGINEELIIVALFELDINLGIMLIELDEIIQEINEALEGDLLY